MSPRKPTDSVIALPKTEELWVSGASGVTVAGAIPKSVRFAEVLDQMAWRRRERLVSVFGAVEFREISTLNVDGIVQHNGNFDVLICSVDDVARLKAALRPPADMIVRRKISFAYSEKTSPGRRAHLFKLGFDDVFYASMTDEEMRIRFRSIMQRYKMYADLAKPVEEGVWTEFTDAHLHAPIRRTQKEIVKKLVLARGDVVRYKDLANYDFTTGEYNVSSLKTTISNLRRKLKGCEIVSVHGEGYRLIIRSESTVNVKAGPCD